jgi:phosphate transport system permease protein
VEPFTGPEQPAGSTGEVGSTPDLSGDRRRHRRERRMRRLFAGSALASLLVSALILVSLFSNGWKFFHEIDWATVYDSNAWNPRQGQFSIATLLAGSLIVTGIALVVAAPLGLGSAVYLSEYARPRTRSSLKPILEVLAGIPSVVLGFFALQWIAPNVVGRLFGEETGRGGSMLAAGIGVGILTVPLVASVSEDAMRAVPSALREASAGLGARRMSTTVRVVLPAAVSGIVAALILAASRAIGETMVVFIAGGAADSATYTVDPREGTLTMTAAMASLATGTDSVRTAATGSARLAIPSLYFVGVVLFFLTMGLNLIGDRFVRRVRQIY